MRHRRSSSHPRQSRRRRNRQRPRREQRIRRASFESLESRYVLTTLSLWTYDFYPFEHFGAGATMGELYRYGGDLTQPLTATLTSSDETEILVPESVTIPANETSVIFPVDTVDDTLLDGEQLVFITATAGPDWVDTALLVQDFETADAIFDQSQLSPGDTLTGTVTVSVSGNTDPVVVPLDSTRPDEIASTAVVVPVGQQSVNFAIPVTSNGIAEGPHMVKVGVPYDSGLFGNTQILSVSDPGVNTIQPADDGHARDADQDGLDFEQLTLGSSQITTQAASPSGSYGETRGILEFDVSSIPSGALIQSAVLTVEVGGQSGSTPMDIDYFAYAGNGMVESADATETNVAIGQLTTSPGIEGLKSTPIPLDIAVLQSLVDGGDYVGIVSQVAPPFADTGRYLSINSSEHSYQFARPSLHLVWSVNNAPLITANSLTIQEGETVVLGSIDLAATDSDSDDASLVFTVSGVSHGDFLVAGSPATSFTQADITAGLVSFIHDDSEVAPSYNVSVSDGVSTFGPQTATINFTHVSDNAPVIVPGQFFEVHENSVNNTLVGAVAFSDVDLPGDSFSFEFTAGNDDGVFSVDSSGVVRVADEMALNYEITTSYTLTVSMSDGVNADVEDITVNVIDGEDIVPYLLIDSTELLETQGSVATIGYVVRVGGDLSQPLTVILTSSDETEVTLPSTVVIPANETEAVFPVSVVDDTLLDGSQVVTISALAVGGESTSTDVTVHDVETLSVEFDQSSGSPGDTLNATITVSTTDRIAPLTVSLDSTRPDEIASIQATIDPSQQSVVIPLSIFADAILEGAHAVKVSASAQGYTTGSDSVAISDSGVVTISPTDDGHATDTDQDGTVFENVATQYSNVITRPAATDGSYGETRGIVEFDASSIPAGAIIESAVLTFDFNSANFSPGSDLFMDVFAYDGNGVVESADANETNSAVGQLTVPTASGSILGSYPIPLDVVAIQSLVDSGGHLGIVTTMQPSAASPYLSYYSSDWLYAASRPAVHLVLAYPPALLNGSLAVSEGETVVLTADDLAASDADTDDTSLTFTVSNVSGGQFLVGGSPATSFTQAQIAAGQVAFAHDDSELAPVFSVEVSDGTYSAGPQSASIGFSNVNDNTPQIPAGQTFSVSEDALAGADLGAVSFSDSDLPPDTLVVSIVAGNDDGVFSVDTAGNITVADNSNLDFESTSTYALTINVFDGANTGAQVVTVNVLDVEETKFYVVNNNSNDRTYEYDGSGAAIENYTLSSGNSAPRGAASTAAGDRVWVIDNDRSVYVYDTSGGLLGSWSAGSLSGSAQPHGIATDGTDVWIVDARSDRVYRYTGAASRLSGSQSASSNFKLANGNRAPKGITTDGSSLWVVNNSSNDRVYKYSTSGSYQGNWSIDSANGSPTGLTIDPANVSDIWIVDSSDDRVYQYTGAATRTSGSQSASAWFGLASGNSNPQGIADPPPPAAIQSATARAIGAASSTYVGVSSASGRAVTHHSFVDDSTRLTKRIIHVAREQVFASLLTDRYEMPRSRPPWSAASASDPDRRSSDLSTKDECAAVDAAFESALISALES